MTAELAARGQTAAGTAVTAAPAAPAVQVQGVTHTYPGTAVPVLDGIDLVVGAGDFVCLLGASGCGKSTLLNIVAGLVTPTTGTVQVASDRPALMFQEPALLPWLTAGANVELALRARGLPRKSWREESDRLLTLVNLDGSRGKRVHELSGGMRQRVALARALAQDSSVLLMDEPFAALDAITRDLLHEELTRVWQEQGIAVVFVTHNVREAVRLGQRVVLMGSRPGRVVREWEVEVEQPRQIESPGVAALAAEITAQLREEISRHGR